MAAPTRPLARAVLAGLTLGMLAAAFIFLYGSVTHLTQDCSFPDTEECTFELENAREIGKLQGYAAIGCALLAGGLFLFARRK